MNNPFSDGLTVEIGGDAGSLTSEIDTALSSIGGLETVVAGLGATLGTLGSVYLSNAASEAADFEEQMAGIERVTDPQTADEMGEAIQGMASEMPLAHEELSQIAESAGRLGVEGEELEDFTENVAMLATSTDLAADEAGDALARISTLMDIPIEDSEELGSAINELANNFGTSASEITDAMTRAGGSFASLGVGEDEALGLSAAMNEVSPSSRQAAGNLERMSEALMDPGNVEEIADALGLSTDEFQEIIDQDPQEAMLMVSEAMAEGGDTSTELRESLGETARGFDALGRNTDAAREATDSAGEQFEDATALQEEFETASSTFNAQLQILRNELTNISQQIGAVLLPFLAELLSAVGDAVSWFADFNEQTNGLAGTLSAIGVTVSGFAVSIAALASQLGFAASTTSALGAAFTALTGPIGIVIAAVAALTAAFVTDFGGIRTATMEVVEVLQEALQPAIDWLQSDGVGIFHTLREAVGEFVEFVEPHFETVVGLIRDGLIVYIETMVTVWQTAFDVISEVVTTVWESVLEPFLSWFTETIVDNFEEPIEGAQETFGVWAEKVGEFTGWLETEVLGPFLEWFEATVGDTLDRIGEWWDDHGETVMAIVETLFDTLQTIVEGWIGHVTDVLTAFFALLRGDWETFSDSVQSIVDRLAEAVTTVFETLSATVTGIVSALASSVIGYVQGLYDDFTNWVDNLYTGVTGTFGTLYDSVTGTISDLMSGIISTILGTDVQDAFFEILNNAYSWLTGTAVDNFLSAGRGLVDAVVDGIRSAPNAIRDAVEDAAGPAARFIPGSDADEGPLSELTAGGEAIPETLAEGALSSLGSLDGALGEMSSPMPAAGAAASSGNAGTVMNLEIDARGADSPQQVRRAGDEVMNRLKREFDSGL